jgi:hypothetical protein
MAVSWELDIPVETILINLLKDLATPHGDHLFRSRKTAIVSHDAAHEPRP